jgi:hypothetical protein
MSKQNGLSAGGHLRPLETSLRALGKMLTGRWLGLRRSRSPIAEDSRTPQDESFRPNLKYCVPALPVGLAVTLGTPLVRVQPAGSECARPTSENESGPPATRLDSGSVRLWQTSGLEKGQSAAHIRVMEKMTVLALVIAIIVLAAVYLLMRRKRS